MNTGNKKSSTWEDTLNIPSNRANRLFEALPMSGSEEGSHYCFHGVCLEVSGDGKTAFHRGITAKPGGCDGVK